MPILKIEQTRSFETSVEGEPAPLDETLAEAIERLSAPSRPAPRTRQSKSAPSSSAGRSPSPSGRAPARRLSTEDAVEELRGMEWLALCGLDEPSPPPSFVEVDADPLWVEWAERSGV